MKKGRIKNSLQLLFHKSENEQPWVLPRDGGIPRDFVFIFLSMFVT